MSSEPTTFDLGTVALADDRRTRRKRSMFTDDFLRHSGIASRSTASVLRVGHWQAVNGNTKAGTVSPGDLVTVSLADALLLPLLTLSEHVRAVAQVGDQLLLRASSPDSGTS